MSSKTTIILTDDNEHWYIDCSEPIIKEGNKVGDGIFLEFNKKNAIISDNDEHWFEIELINPDSDLYNHILYGGEHTNIKQKYAYACLLPHRRELGGDIYKLIKLVIDMADTLNTTIHNATNQILRAYRS